MQAPAIGGKGNRGHTPDGLAGRQMANLGMTDRGSAKVAPVVGIATKGFPRDLFVVQCQDVAVGAEVRRPRWTDGGSSEWHGSPTHAPDTSRVDWRASERIRCRCGDRHEARPKRIMSPQTFSLRKISRHRLRMNDTGQNTTCGMVNSSCSSLAIVCEPPVSPPLSVHRAATVRYRFATSS
jgi:hypothetical protein